MAEPWEERDPKTGMFPLPSNKYGITESSMPIPPDIAQKLFDGPIAAVQPAPEADRARVDVLRDLTDPFSPLIDDLLSPVVLG